MRIILDAFGGDNAPSAIIEGGVMAVKEGVSDVVFCGQKEKIEKELEKYEYNSEHVSIISAEEIINMHDEPAKAVKQKKESSLVKALIALKNKEGDAVISAGSTGALMAGAILYVGRIKGVMRPALAPIMPTATGPQLLIDVGANADCKPAYLNQFGAMGSIYMENVMGVKTPRVGLANIGEEETKGNELMKDSHKLLKENKSINFIGNIEGRDIPEGKADVLVSDGFTGNIILKLIEGMGMFFYGVLKGMFKKNILTKASALVVKNGLGEFKKMMDYAEYGGSPMLGISMPVLKAHGSSNGYAIYSAIKVAVKMVENDVCGKIADNIRE